MPWFHFSIPHSSRGPKSVTPPFPGDSLGKRDRCGTKENSLVEVRFDLDLAGWLQSLLQNSRNTCPLSGGHKSVKGMGQSGAKVRKGSPQLVRDRPITWKTPTSG